MKEKMGKDLVREQFGANAAAYATSVVHAKGASLARLVELVQPQPEWLVLDIASAAGHTAFAFAPHVAHVTATDITPEMLPVAAALAEEKGIHNLTLDIADAEDLPHEDGAFDLVTCRIAPHHFPRVERFVAESARVLRPRGMLAVVDNVVPGKGGDDDMAGGLTNAGEYVNSFEKLRDPSHHRALSVNEWTRLFEDDGFTLLHVETALKAMDFDPWATRLGATPETVETLRSMLLDAPPKAAEFLRPVTTDGILRFHLTEGILVGRK